MKHKNKTRVQVDFSKNMVEILHSVRDKLDSTTNTEAIRRSLKMMNELLDEEVYVKDKNGSFYPVMLF